MRPHAPVILLTGFEPFAGMDQNPSADLAVRWQNRLLAGCQVHTMVLPVCFGLAAKKLMHKARDLRREHAVPLILATGLAVNRQCLSLERIAINCADTSSPDAAGHQPLNERIHLRGADGLFARLPLVAMLRATQNAGCPAEISDTAGTYVCNEVFYRLMHMLSRPSWKNTQGGFIHLPPMGTVPGALIDKALEAAVCAVLQASDQ
jgi:pyroglutamyl-peptidase